MTNAPKSRGRWSRRSFLTGSAVGGALGVATSASAKLVSTAPDVAPAQTLESQRTAISYPLRGTYQPGIVTPQQSYARFIAFNINPGAGADGIRRAFGVWTADAESLMQGQVPLADSEPELVQAPAGLTITFGLGPGFFDAIGAPDKRPPWLAQLPSFRVDRLQDRFSGGDVVVQICSYDQMTVAHAARVLTRGVTTFLTTRWVQNGFMRITGPVHKQHTPRNLLGQVDGTSNPQAGQDDNVVFRSEDADWLNGGSSLVIRRIAMDIHGWEKLGASEREQVIGRKLSNGAPLTGTDEHDAIDLDARSASGLPVIPDFAHVRRVIKGSQRILRRPYNYDIEPEPGNAVNTGLIFVSYQADPVAQYVPIQQRLDKLDLLNEWTTPIGSAVFAVPRGIRNNEYLAQSLLES